MASARSTSKTVNIHDAKTRLSQLVERVEAGEEIVIARAGRPVARLSPLESRHRPRRLGRLDGRFRIPDDFNAALPDDVLDAFFGAR
jgi:prevent-host-death family protein